MHQGYLWKLLLSLFVVAAFSLPLCADSITIETPSGSITGGGAVDATAQIVTGTDTVTITLTNLEANPGNVAQLISDFDFVLSNGATSGTLASSSGQQITVAGDGTASLGSTGSTGWGLNNDVSGGLQLDALGFVGPAGLILGPADGSSLYSNANASIAGNGPHNPFLNQTATFTVTVPGVTADTTITDATFSFGTTPGADNVSVPEPASLCLLGFGLLGLAGLKRGKK